MRPTSEQETGMAIIAVVIILLFLFLSSCSTKKTITEYVAVHDTLTVHKSDTIRDVVYKTHTDTIRETITREIVIRQDSAKRLDTIRINTLNDRYRYVYVGDSSHAYRSVVDTLKAVIDKSKERETVKKATRPRAWELIVFGVFIVVVISLVWKIR